MRFIKKAVSFLLAAVLLQFTAFAVFSSEANITASKTVHTISPGLKYINSVEVCEGIRQEIFAFDYTPEMQTGIVAAYGQYIYGFNSVGSMINTYSGEGRVVGGINTDFFITNTGIPLSCLIADNEIISSCDGRVAIGFDKSGNAVIGNPEIKAEIVSSDGLRKLPVAHINKTPAIWGLYLVTDKFSTSTKTSIDTVEIVLKPIEIIEDIQASDNLSENSTANINTSFSSYTYGNIDSDELNAETENLSNIDEEPLSVASGAVSDINLQAGKRVKTVVTEIRRSVRNGAVPDGCYVACIPVENFSYLADGISVGDEFIISVTCNELFEDCVNVFGAGTQIVKDGARVEQENSSLFNYRQPRTAAGIREDGSVLFVCVDGRNSGVSSGYTISELSDYLISMGCRDAVNFDGGGSTTFYAADIGEVNSNLKNTPSDGSERRVADGLMFINFAPAIGDIANASAYPSRYYVFNKGAQLKLDPLVLYADTNLHPVVNPDVNYRLTVDMNFGLLNDGIFVPNGLAGNAGVYLYEPSLDFSLGIGEIVITDVIDKLAFSSDKTLLNPFEDRAFLNVSASLNTIPVEFTKDSLDNIMITKRIISENSSVEYVYADPSEAYIDYETFSFVPLKRGETYRITAESGGISEYVDISVDSLPFSDMNGHWAAYTSYDMFKKGYFIGEISSEGNRMFYPERHMTGAEFCVVLSRIPGLSDEGTVTTEDSFNDAVPEASDVSQEKPAYDFHDVPEWALQSVKTLYNKGYIDELVRTDEKGETTIGADEYITRLDVIRVLGTIIDLSVTPQEKEKWITYDFYDYVPEKDADTEFLQSVCNLGILQGYEDGTMRQNSTLTRAEAATVFSRLISMIN